MRDDHLRPLIRPKRKKRRRHPGMAVTRQPVASNGEALSADDALADSGDSMSPAELAGEVAVAGAAGTAAAPPRILVVHPGTAVRRGVRDALEGLTEAVVDAAPTGARGFEMALERDYRLFIFGVQLPDLGGELLYQLIETAYRHHGARGGPARFAPAVTFVLESPNADKREELRREARVKGVLTLPVRIDRLLEAVGDAVARKGVGRLP